MRAFLGWVLSAVFTVSSSAAAQERIGVGLDLFGDWVALSGEQVINNSPRDESRTFGNAGFLSGSAWVLFKTSEHLKIGPGLRIYGNYASAGQDSYLFGVLTDAFFTGEFSLHAIEKVEAVFGGRAGLSVLFPGGAFGEEIRRLQAEGVGVWSVPRLGWLLGLSVGARRQMAKSFFLRMDIRGQTGQLFLFGTEEIVQGFRVKKSWSSHSLRLGLTLSAEIAF